MPGAGGPEWTIASQQGPGPEAAFRPEGGQHTPLAPLLRWYFDLQCRDIYAFFSYNTDYTVATFYLGLDSLSQTLIFTFFLEGVGGGVQRATLKSSFFHILPFPPISAPLDTF